MVKKNFLGVYFTEEEAINFEVKYDTNIAFFNLACQTTNKFKFDRTGLTNTPESNKMRSNYMTGTHLHTIEGKKEYPIIKKIYDNVHKKSLFY